MAQRCDLKIHCPCNKCLKTNQKILKDVEGVEIVTFDLVNMKATVSGNMISPDVLCKKLRQSRKRSELCPVLKKLLESRKRSELEYQQLPKYSPVAQSEPDNGQVEEDIFFTCGPRAFKIETLVEATNNFHDDNKLGEGGFGAVYKGTTQDGIEIAVKKLSATSEPRTEQFKLRTEQFLNEVNLLAEIRHRNIVRLYGYCAEGSERLVVYEYLSNKSLDKFLCDADKRRDLDWQKRYNIIQGMARGLHYLHQDCPLRIVHRDINPSNILLDEKLNPKIADFDIARLFPEDKSHVITKLGRGTFYYRAPEYATLGESSPKADVYCFGLVLLELVTGRMPLFKDMKLSEVWKSFSEGNSVQTIDQGLIIRTCDEEQAKRCIHVGLLCTQNDPKLRPLMSDVIGMLSPPYGPLCDPEKPPLYKEAEPGSLQGSAQRKILLAMMEED